MSNQNYFNILDFGSSKLRFSVFGDDLKLKYSTSKSVEIENNYLNKIEIFNDIIKKAEKKISKHIEDIILTLDTTEMFVVQFSLYKDLNSKLKTKKVYQSLILEVRQIINTFYDQYEIIHIIFDKCMIDKNIFFQLPQENKEIDNIKVDFKLICYPKILLNKLRKNFNKNNINISNFLCTSYIKSLSYLQNIDSENISFIEIGLKKTCLISYEKKKLKIFQSIPIGGFHITQDISKIFKITFKEAEIIKRSFYSSDTEFTYQNKNQNDTISVNDILRKNISIDLLKKVILFRIQEIMDLTYKESNKYNFELNFKNSDLFFIGDGSLLFNNNSFHLKDKFEFKALNFYHEKDSQICNSCLMYYLNNHQIPSINNKNQGLFEKFFNYFSK